MKTKCIFSEFFLQFDGWVTVSSVSAFDWVNKKETIGIMHQNLVKHGMEEWFLNSKRCNPWSRETDPPQDCLIPSQIKIKAKRTGNQEKVIEGQFFFLFFSRYLHSKVKGSGKSQNSNIKLNLPTLCQQKIMFLF